VVAFGQLLVDDGRFGAVQALGLDESLMVRWGPWRRQLCTTRSSTSSSVVTNTHPDQERCE
jgi:hypothetical protein